MTSFVPMIGYGNGMQTPLQPGDEIKCQHCGQWHPVVTQHTTGTPYTVSMLYWKCAKGMYFAGSRGHVSRHQTRRPGGFNIASKVLNFS